MYKIKIKCYKLDHSFIEKSGSYLRLGVLVFHPFLRRYTLMLTHIINIVTSKNFVVLRTTKGG